MTLTALRNHILTALRNEAEGLNDNGWGVGSYLRQRSPRRSFLPINLPQ
jgi:predicted glutamine amidotransferase